jgi:hypothetical protein
MYVLRVLLYISVISKYLFTSFLIELDQSYSESV